MKKTLFLIFLFFHSHLFGCATCQSMSPTVAVEIALSMEKNLVTAAHFRWSFSDSYLQELRQVHDKNRDKKLDKQELKQVLQLMLDYLLPKQMVTKVSYEKKQFIELQGDYKDFKLHIVDGYLLFEYTMTLHQKIEDASMLGFECNDDEGFFIFVVQKIGLENDFFYHDVTTNLSLGSIYFSSRPIDNVVSEADALERNTMAVEAVKSETNLLQKSIDKIKAILESIQKGDNPWAYAWLLIFAYAYGLVHALGPGHGKMLVASYFLSHDKSYAKALGVSAAIGIVHTFSAFVLTVVIYFGVQTFMAQFMDETVYYTTKISALFILGIVFYLGWKKYRTYRAWHHARLSNFSVTPHASSCGCGACKVDSHSTDLALILSAGIIPCPTTVTLFIFSFSLGLYFVGFMAALLMSAGMSTIIYISALLSVTVRQKNLHKQSLVKYYVEFLSLGIIFILGMVLLIL